MLVAMNNFISQDEQFLARTQGALPTIWVKPHMTAVPLHQALSGGSLAVDGTNNGVPTTIGS